MNVENVTICLPIGLRDRAKKSGVNMSFEATQAIQKAVLRNTISQVMNEPGDIVVKKPGTNEEVRV